MVCQKPTSMLPPDIPIICVLQRLILCLRLTRISDVQIPCMASFALLVSEVIPRRIWFWGLV